MKAQTPRLSCSRLQAGVSAGSALPSRISPNGLAVCSDAVLAAMVYVSSLVQMRCALCVCKSCCERCFADR
jgi:hypothetical protein